MAKCNQLTPLLLLQGLTLLILFSRSNCRRCEVMLWRRLRPSSSFIIVRS